MCLLVCHCITTVFCKLFCPSLFSKRGLMWSVASSREVSKVCARDVKCSFSKIATLLTSIWPTQLICLNKFVCCLFTYSLLLLWSLLCFLSLDTRESERFVRHSSARVHICQGKVLHCIVSCIHRTSWQLYLIYSPPQSPTPSSFLPFLPTQTSCQCLQPHRSTFSSNRLQPSNHNLQLISNY